MAKLISSNSELIFSKLDEDGDGVVRLEELKWLLERAGIHVCLSELEQIVGKQSLDSIDFCVFYDNIIQECSRSSGDGCDHVRDHQSFRMLEDDLLKAFQVFDSNGDGVISGEELQSALARLGLWSEHGGQDCNSMINEFDRNCDGVLDFEEFKDMMLAGDSSLSS